MIEILLATYDSSRYLREQIDSILAQTCADWRLLVHDGGSTDETESIVREYERRDGRIRWVGQERLSALGNFAKLWRLSHRGYVMFADHDDVWLPDKIEVELAAMRKAEAEAPGRPVLVFSDARVVDAGLKPLCDSSWDWQGLDPRRTELRQLLFQNVAAGNTMLANGALRSACPEIPPAALMHDHWLMLVACLTGRIVRVDQPLLLYRQHGDNVLGAGKMSLGYFIARARMGIASARARINRHLDQAAALAAAYGDKLERGRDRDLLVAAAGLRQASWFGRLRILLRHRIAKCGLARNVITWICMGG